MRSMSAVVVAQQVEWSLPTLEIRSLNPDIDRLYWPSFKSLFLSFQKVYNCNRAFLFMVKPSRFIPYMKQQECQIQTQVYRLDGNCANHWTDNLQVVPTTLCLYRFEILNGLKPRTSGVYSNKIYGSENYGLKLTDKFWLQNFTLIGQVNSAKLVRLKLKKLHSLKSALTFLYRTGHRCQKQLLS